MHNLTAQTNPPEGHEIDECANCHAGGEHRGHELDYIDHCADCAENPPQLTMTLELHFTTEQYLEARKWAFVNKYRYADPIHLMIDWVMKENVGWKNVA